MATGITNRGGIPILIDAMRWSLLALSGQISSAGFCPLSDQTSAVHCGNSFDACFTPIKVII
jgi:hypothetical protein